MEVFSALEQLGLTPLEARAYVVLLRNGPSTAYRVAQGIERPASNIYRLMAALVSKGLVEKEDGDKTHYRAVPCQQALDLLERSFKRHREIAEHTLSTLERSAEDERVYRLGSRDHVFERCRAALRRAEEVALVDAFPGPLEEIRPEIEATTRRSVQVIVKAYRPTLIEGVEVIVDYRGAAPLEMWGGDWLNLVVDGREYVLAFLDRESSGLHQGIWTSSANLSWIYHCGLWSEITLDGVYRLVEMGASLADVRNLLQKYRTMSEKQLGDPGLKRRP